MNRLRDLAWRRIILGCALIAVAGFAGFFWEAPRYGDEERYVLSKFERGEWTRREVTGAQFNRQTDKSKPGHYAIAAVLVLSGVGMVVFELRHLRR